MDGVSLAKTVSSILSLSFNRRIPPAVEVKNIRCILQI